MGNDSTGDKYWYRDAAKLQAEIDKHGSVAGAARANDTKSTTVNRWAVDYGIKSNNKRTPGYLRGPDYEKVHNPPPLIPIEHAQLRLQGDFGVGGDWHAPAIHYPTMYRFFDDCVARDIKSIIIPGDFTNQDALAGHEEKQKGAEMGPEMEHLHYAVDLALDAVDELIVTFGNHDRHAMAKLQVDFARSVRMLLCDLAPEKLARIRITGLDHVIVDTERGPWLIAHTRSYSVQPLAYPCKLALRHGMHVSGSHRHHHAQGKAANGKDVVDLPGLMDVDRLAYVHRYTNALPEMQNGYGLLIDGFMRLPMLYS